MDTHHVPLRQTAEGTVRGEGPEGREGVSGGENEEDETVGGRIFIGSIFIGIFMVCRVYTPHEPQTTESCVQKLKSSVTLCLECHMEREGEQQSQDNKFSDTKLRYHKIISQGREWRPTLWDQSTSSWTSVSPTSVSAVVLMIIIILFEYC